MAQGRLIIFNMDIYDIHKQRIGSLVSFDVVRLASMDCSRSLAVGEEFL